MEPLLDRPKGVAMVRIVLCGKTYWAVDGIVFTTLAAAVEYLQGR